MSSLYQSFLEEREKISGASSSSTAAPLGSTLQPAENQPATPYTDSGNSYRILIDRFADAADEEPDTEALEIEPEFYGVETGADGPVIADTDLTIPYVANELQSQISPEQAAKARELYEQTGIDTTGYPEATKALEVDAAINKRAEDLQAAPLASRWMAENPSNAAISADLTKEVAEYESIFAQAFAARESLKPADLERVVERPGLLTSIGRDIADIPFAVATSVESIEANTLSSKEALFELGLSPAQLSSEEKARLNYINQSRGAVPRTTVGKYAQISAQQLPVLANLYIEGGKGAAAAAGPAAAIGALVGPGKAAAFAAFSGKVGFRIGMAVESFQQLSGEARREFLQDRDLAGNKINRDLVNKASLVVGVLAAGAEVVGGLAVSRALSQSLRQILKSQLSTKTGRQILAEAFKGQFVSALMEGGTEGVQEAIKIAATHIIRDIQGGNFAEITWDAISERLLEAVLAGSISSASMTAGPAALSVATDARRQKQAELARERVVRAIEAFREGDLNNRSPSAAEDFLNTLNQNAEPVLIEPQALSIELDAQGVNPVEFFESVGVTPEALDEALRTGQDVEVNAATMVQVLSDSDVTEAVVNNVRAEPGAPTTSEVALQVDSVRKRIEEVTAQYVSEPTPESVAVADAIAEQLVATGKETEQSAATLASVIEAFYRVAQDAADKEGRGFSVAQFFEDLGLTVRTPEQVAQEESAAIEARQAVEQELDPLNQSQEWRNVEISMPMETGETALIPAGIAFDSIRTRMDAAEQLLRCVRGS